MSLVRPFIRPLPFSFQRPLNVRNTTDSHALNVERSAIEANGGTSNKVLNGPDGYTNGFIRRPMETKYATGNRFRIGRRDHEAMVKENGIYIFVDENNHQIKMSAAQADSLVRYKWMQDLRQNNVSYEHGFIFKSDVFR